MYSEYARPLAPSLPLILHALAKATCYCQSVSLGCLVLRYALLVRVSVSTFGFSIPSIDEHAKCSRGRQGSERHNWIHRWESRAARCVLPESGR
jgi:hypothetical protein